MTRHLVNIKAWCILAVAILLALALGMFGSTVYGQQTGPSNTEALSPRAYLPLTIRPPSPAKRWSGVHLGNRSNDWNSSLLRRIDPALGGQWPNVVVVLSNQVYKLSRPTDSNASLSCRVKSASESTPNSTVFSYIKRAAQAGVRVVIRIYPSPGNFVDWSDPARQNHYLSIGIPVGPQGYCDPEHYRSPADIGDEMAEIHKFNVSQGFQEFGFEPANEPNVDQPNWYGPSTNPPLSVSTAWTEMSAYFSAIYDWVHTQYASSSIRVLSPPMSPSAYAEEVNMADYTQPNCEPMILTDYPQGKFKNGYEALRQFLSSKSDGVDWHNYWYEGKEAYDLCPNGQHVSISFPNWMKEMIRLNQRPLTISEADLSSPGTGNPIPNKNSPYAVRSANSIQQFFFEEWFSDGGSVFGVKPNIASWLLNDNVDTGTEHNWHEAYDDSNVEYDWFRLWYTGGEDVPARKE